MRWSPFYGKVVDLPVFHEIFHTTYFTEHFQETSFIEYLV